MPHGSPVPWPPGPSSTVFPRTSCALYFVWCPHLWLERRWRQSLQGTTKGELIKINAHEGIQIIRQFLLFPQRILPNGWMGQWHSSMTPSVIGVAGAARWGALWLHTCNLHWSVIPEENISSLKISAKTQEVRTLDKPFSHRPVKDNAVEKGLGRLTT